MNAHDEIISSIKHPAVVGARKGLGQLGKRRPTTFLVDGHHLVSQALASRAPIEAAFFLHPVEHTEERDLLEHARRAGVPRHLVSRGVFFKILGLGYETAVRVLAVVKRPASASPAEFVTGEACLLVGERIRDPRNVGVLVRTADAWGLPGAVFSEDSADPYSRGSVRSSTGSIFRVPVGLAAHLVECLEGLKAKSLRIIGTSARAAVPSWQADLTGSCAIVLGSEAEGLSPEVFEVCDDLITIPMAGGARSLNVTVAAGIILYERARQRRAR